MKLMPEAQMFFRFSLPFAEHKDHIVKSKQACKTETEQIQQQT